MFLACSFPSVLRATAACTFSTCQLPKPLWHCSAFCMFASKRAWRHNEVHVFSIWIWTSKSAPTLRWTSDRASRHSGVQLFISDVPAWLRTHRFSKPTFEPQPQIIGKYWKPQCFMSSFSRTCIFFLLTFSLPWSSFFFSSLLWLFPPLLFHLSMLSKVWCSLTSKLPSVTQLPLQKGTLGWEF